MGSLYPCTQPLPLHPHCPALGCHRGDRLPQRGEPQSRSTAHPPLAHLHEIVPPKPLGVEKAGRAQHRAQRLPLPPLLLLPSIVNGVQGRLHEAAAAAAAAVRAGIYNTGGLHTRHQPCAHRPPCPAPDHWLEAAGGHTIQHRSSSGCRSAARVHLALRDHRRQHAAAVQTGRTAAQPARQAGWAWPDRI